MQGSGLVEVSRYIFVSPGGFSLISDAGEWLGGSCEVHLRLPPQALATFGHHWQWHGSVYLGAIHGYAGIALALLQAGSEVGWDSLGFLEDQSPADPRQAARRILGGLISTISKASHACWAGPSPFDHQRGGVVDEMHCSACTRAPALCAAPFHPTTPHRLRQTLSCPRRLATCPRLSDQLTTSSCRYATVPRASSSSSPTCSPA